MFPLCGLVFFFTTKQFLGCMSRVLGRSAHDDGPGKGGYENAWTTCIVQAVSASNLVCNCRPISSSGPFEQVESETFFNGHVSDGRSEDSLEDGDVRVAFCMIVAWTADAPL